MTRLLCLGFGYSAAKIASRLAADGWRVTGTATTNEGCQRIAALGHAAILFDGNAPSPQLAAALATATHLVVSAPPGPNGDPLLARHARDVAGSPTLVRAVYFSTVGVYGDCDGAWVDETAAPTPSSDRAHRRATAESAWRAVAREASKHVVCFRLPGIYGPGRSAIDTLRDGTAKRIVKPGQVFNRIHVDDIASATIASLTGRGSAPVLNIADDEPAPPQDVVAYAARLLGVAPPPEVSFETAHLSPMAASFYAENKRVSNRLMKADLRLTLAYPTYREGLSAIVANGA